MEIEWWCSANNIFCQASRYYLEILIPVESFVVIRFNLTHSSQCLFCAPFSLHLAHFGLFLSSFAEFVRLSVLLAGFLIFSASFAHTSAYSVDFPLLSLFLSPDHVFSPSALVESCASFPLECFHSLLPRFPIISHLICSRCHLVLCSIPPPRDV